MERWRKNLWLLWIGSFMISASFSMVVPFLPIFLVQQLHIQTHTNIWSGLLFSVPFLVGAIVSPYWGSLADKYGRKPMILRSGFSLCVLYILTALVRNPVELLGIRALQGLLAGYIPASIALIGTATPEKEAGYALALMSTAGAAGSIMGPLVGGFVSHVFSNRIAFCSAGVLCGLATVLAWLWVTEDSFVPTKTRTSVLHAIHEGTTNLPLLSALCVNALTAFSIMTIEPVLPLYIVHLGTSTQDASLVAGIVFSIAGIATVIFAPLWGKLSDHRGFRLTLVIGLLGGALGNFAQIPFHNVWAFASIRFVYGAFFCAVFPAINGLIVRSTTPDFRGRAFALNQTANQVGNMLGPMVGGYLGDVFQVHSVFGVTGALLLVTLVLAYWATGRYDQGHPRGDLATSSH